MEKHQHTHYSRLILFFYWRTKFSWVAILIIIKFIHSCTHIFSFPLSLSKIFFKYYDTYFSIKMSSLNIFHICKKKKSIFVRAYFCFAWKCMFFILNLKKIFSYRLIYFILISEIWGEVWCYTYSSILYPTFLYFPIKSKNKNKCEKKNYVPFCCMHFTFRSNVNFSYNILRENNFP